MVSGIWKWYMRVFDFHARPAGFDYFRVGLVRFRSTRVSAGERRGARKAKGNTAVDAALPALGDQGHSPWYDTVQGVGSGEAV